MSTVNTEGKLDWYLSLELGLRSLGAYLQLGISLGAVQARHACIPLHLTQYRLRRAWRRHVSDASEDLEFGLNHAKSLSLLDAHLGGHQGTLHGTAASSGATAEVAAALSLSTGLTSPVELTMYVASLLAKMDALIAITHAEGAAQKLLSRMIAQAVLFTQHDDAAAMHTNGQAPSATETDYKILFQLAESDTAYAHLVEAGLPVAITYRDFIVLTILLSEALAWDLLWIHEAADRRNAQHLHQQPVPRVSPSRAVEADCVAVMLPNSVEYNAIWMAASRSGPVHTLLDVLYRNSNHVTGHTQDSGTYRPCRTALLNTNLPSNAMLYHALECAGCAVVIMDAAYIPLLFSESTVEAEMSTSECGLNLRMPAHVKRVYLWRYVSSNGSSPPAGVTPAMLAALEAFNAAAYDVRPADAAYITAARTPPPHEGSAEALTHLILPPAPPLDLYDAVKEFYTRARATPAATAHTASPTHLLSHPHVRFLVHALAAHPPPSWQALVALQPSPKSPTSSAGARTLAHSTTARQQLIRYLSKLESYLTPLLRRFHHTQPVLLIYTSGTTGLPKAARFSHLRFFATGFLSRVLYFRLHIAETVVAQEEEKAFIAAHPQAVARFDGNKSRDTRTIRDTDGPQRVEEVPAHAVDTAAVIAAAKATRCPPIPELFGVKPLDHDRHHRNVVEATLALIGNVILWWVVYFASFFGCDHLLLNGLERFWYTPVQRQVVAQERSRITIYNCLPMYHTVGSVFCLGHLLHALDEQQAAATAGDGTARVPTVRMVLRSKFSASKFRADLERYHVTVVQYIGEILRYAVLYERRHFATSVHPSSSSTTSPGASLGKNRAEVGEAALLAEANRARWRVPYAFGNGLRADIWLECMQQLNIAHPVEFYSSTEGNIFLLNLFGMPGVVGHIPRFPFPFTWISMQYFPLFPFRVLRYDEEQQVLYRDPKTGYGAHCPIGEVGEVVGEVIEGFDLFALRRFDGYQKTTKSANITKTTTTAEGQVIPTTNTLCTHAHTQQRNNTAAEEEQDMAARQAKVVRHVLWPYANDCYFLSGDLVRMDQGGFCYFVDRVGDTFRWKGENVSTLEVSNALNRARGVRGVSVQEAVVYGAQLPGREGRAGMAMVRLQLDAITTTVAHTSAGALSLVEERRFLEEELYPLLSGRTTRNAGGAVNASVLPPYAIPLFLRVQDHAPEEGELGSTNATGSGNGSGGRRHAEGEDTDTQTTTFKYKKGALMKQGYDFAGSSTQCTTLPLSGWLEDSVAQQQQQVTPYTRVYVLVTNPAMFEALALPQEAKGEERVAGGEKRKPARQEGYLPLTAAARSLLGENLDKCGW